MKIYDAVVHVLTQFFHCAEFAERTHSFMRCKIYLQTKRRYIKKVLGFLDFAGTTTTNMRCEYLRNKFTVLHQQNLLRRRKEERRTLQYSNKYKNPFQERKLKMSTIKLLKFVKSLPS